MLDFPAVSHPSLYVLAWPRETLFEISDLPQNSTELVTDWQALLEPMASLRALAPNLLGQTTTGSSDWLISDRHVDVASVDRALLLEAARDSEVIELFERCRGSLIDQRYPDTDPAHTIAIRALARSADSELALRDRAVPILLGIACAAAVAAGIGYRSHEMRVMVAQRTRAIVDARQRATGPANDS